MGIRRTQCVAAIVASAVVLVAAACGPATISPQSPAPTPCPSAMRPSVPGPSATRPVAPSPSATHPGAPSPIATASAHPYSPAFGIDYGHPEAYLEQGEQSVISDPGQVDALRAEEQSLAQLEDIYHWLKGDFEAYRAGGKTIGVVTADQLLEERRLGGCHDHGLVYAGMARELGYPAVMVRAVSIAWAEQLQAGQKGPQIGHVFVEVYVDGRWVLIDSTNGWYLDDGYDPADPVIPLKGPIVGSTEEIYGFYVECKGLDTWDFGIHSPAESARAMDEFGRTLDLQAITYPQHTFGHFSR